MSISFVYPRFLWLLTIVPFLILIGWLERRRYSRLRFWISLILRASLILALIAALSGIQVRFKSNILTTIFILDASDSVPMEEQTHGKDLIKKTITNMNIKGNNRLGKENRAAIIVFGEDALVERLASDIASMSDITSIPITTRTDIANALQLAQAIFPGEGAKQIVLLSDGRENLGKAIEQAELAAASNIELLYLPLGAEQSQAEVWLDSIEAPSEIRTRQEFEIKAVIKSNVIADATIRVFENDVLIKSLEQRMLPDSITGSNPNIVRIAVKENLSESENQPTGGNLRRYRVQIIPQLDTRLQNNEASVFTIVHGPPNVIIVEGKPGYGNNLSKILETAKMRVTRVYPQNLPTNLADLAHYDCLILVDVPAADLPSGMLEILPVFVRDLGKGLLMIGGPKSFGAGGYLRTPLEKVLPVDMDVRDKEIQSNLALVLAVDKSGSMGRCHCDNPDLNQTYAPHESGQAKVDIAKEAIMRAAAAIGDQDYLGVVAFDSQPRWILELKPLVDPITLEHAIGSFQAEGQTNMQAGVLEAYHALQKINAKRKHIILMTDGWVHQGDLNLLEQALKEERITLSIVAAGGGAGAYLEALARMGGGEFYPATNIQNVPDIFLKETIKSIGKYVIEEPFIPIQVNPGSNILRGLDAKNLPPLLGYNGSSVKRTARLDLISPLGDPVLATWQYGLGRSIAWTSDLKGQWASQWLKWESFPRFVAQMVSWTLPIPHVEGLSATVKLEENQAVIHIKVNKKDGSPYNFLSGSVTILNPKMQKKEMPLKQVGAGEYQVNSIVNDPGVYLIRAGINDGDQSLGQITLGLVVPYSPEYRDIRTNQGLLEQLAGVTGGEKINSSDPAAIFSRNLPSVESSREIWLPLLILVALFFPLDVGIRRLNIRKRDLTQLFALMSIKYQRNQTTSTMQSRMFPGLFEARQRARRRSASPLVGQERANTPGKTTSQPSNRLEPDLKPENLPAIESDPLSRLREAKKRARR